MGILLANYNSSRYYDANTSSKSNFRFHCNVNNCTDRHTNYHAISNIYALSNVISHDHLDANTNFHSNQHANPRPNTDIYVYASTDFSASHRKAAKAGITTADATDAATHTTDARRISCNLEKLRGWGYTKFSELSSVTCAYSNYLSPQTFAGQFASNWK